MALLVGISHVVPCSVLQIPCRKFSGKHKKVNLESTVAYHEPKIIAGTFHFCSFTCMAQEPESGTELIDYLQKEYHLKGE